MLFLEIQIKCLKETMKNRTDFQTDPESMV